MRILIIHNQLWAHYKSKLFAEIYAELSRKHPDSTLLVGQISLREASRGVMDGDQKIRYDYPYQLLFRKTLDDIPLWDRFRAILRIYREFQPDVLNVTGYFDMAQVLVMLYAKARGVKVVISSESSAADHARAGLKEKLKRFIIRQADAFFCFGKTSADYLETLGARPEDITVRNAAVIDDQVVRDTFANAQTEIQEDGIRRFVFAGRLSSEKNLEMLLRAFGNVSAAAPGKWELWLVGDGPDRSRLENLAGNFHGIHFKGGFPWYEVPGLLAACDVLILPSLSEPWGLVVNEAMTCGMPVIVSSQCGCAPDLVRDGVNGFLFDPASQEQLEEALRYFLQNPLIISDMGKESLKIVSVFSPGKVATEMVNTYKRLSIKVR